MAPAQLWCGVRAGAANAFARQCAGRQCAGESERERTSTRRASERREGGRETEFLGIGMCDMCDMCEDDADTYVHAAETRVSRRRGRVGHATRVESGPVVYTACSWAHVDARGPRCKQNCNARPGRVCVERINLV